MYRKYLFHIAVLFLISGSSDICLNAQEHYKLLPVKVNEKWGFIDTKGEIRISPQFSSANGFSEGQAPVWDTDGKCGYINLNGQFSISAKFDYCDVFSEGAAVIKEKGRYGYIDKSGKFLVPPKWQMAWGFSDGLARVASGELDTRKYGFLNKKGQMVVKPIFPFANDFSEGLALAAVSTPKGLKIGFIDRKGRWIIKPVYGNAIDFSEGFAAVTKEGSSYLFEESLMFDDKDRAFEVFYINKSGKMVFDKTFDHAGEFSEGLAWVEINGKKTIINNEGKVVIITDFTSGAEIAKFCEGFAAVNFADGAKFIDKEGKLVIKTDFDWADNFANGVARVKNVQTNGLESYGYIDKQGNTIWKPTN